VNRKAQRRFLSARLAAERGALLAELLGLHEATLTKRSVFDDWTVKDILAHIAAWDRWEEKAVQDLAAANAAFVSARRDWSLDDVIAELMAARSEWLAWMESVPDEEFFQPRAYYGHDWTFSEVPMLVQWEHDAGHASEIASWRKAGGFRRENGPKSVLLAALDAAREELLAAAALVPADERTTRPVVGRWTLKDVLGHIADWEWYAADGLRQMAAGQRPEPEPLASIEAWNIAHAEARRDQPWDEVWGDLSDAHAAFRATLDGTGQEVMANAFPFAWGGKGTPYRWASIFIEHDREHARELRDDDRKKG
jgi:hypothetical protein